MTVPSLDTVGAWLTLFTAIFGAITAGLWLALVLWAFRDMRLRSRDPFAQLLAALLVAAIPFFGIILYLILRPPETLAERYERALEEEALLQEIEELPRCPKCSRVVEDEWAICPSCHYALKKQCPTCYSLIELPWMRCPFCTAEQPEEPPVFRPRELTQLLPHNLPNTAKGKPLVKPLPAPAAKPTEPRRVYVPPAIETIPEEDPVKLVETIRQEVSSKAKAEDTMALKTESIIEDLADPDSQPTTKMLPIRDEELS